MTEVTNILRLLVKNSHWEVAQWLEQRPYKPCVSGSILGFPINYKNPGAVGARGFMLHEN